MTLIEPATMSFSAAFARAGYPISPKDSSLLQRLIEAREVANLVCYVASPCLPQRMASSPCQRRSGVLHANA